MKTKVRALTVKGFRGIRNTTLDFDGKSVVLCGENGFGKSSLVDAFEFLFKGRVSSLESTQATSTKRHGPHIDFELKDTEIGLVLQNPDTTIARTFEEFSCIPNEPSFWQIGQGSHFILKRQQLLDFIVAKPAGRYEQIATIIGVNELETVELNFKHRRDELVQESTGLSSRLQKVRDELKSRLQIDSLAADQILLGINKQLLEWGQSEIKSLSEINDTKLAVIRAAVDPNKVQRTASLKGLLGLSSGILDDEDLRDELTKLIDALYDLHEDAELVKAIIFHDVLHRGRTLIEEIRPEQCPICEQPIDHEDLTQRLERRLELMEEAGSKSEIIAAQIGQLVGILEEFVKNLRALWKGVQETGLEIDLGPIKDYGNFLKQLIDEIQTTAIVRIDRSALEGYSSSGELLSWERLSEGLERLIQNEIDKLHVSASDEQAVQAIDFLTGIAQLVRDHNNLASQYRIKVRIKDQISTVYDALIETKRREIQLIYDSLQSDMQAYYDILHPGEHHREIKIKVDDRKRGSADIKMGFHDRSDEDPRAYQSEGHLDTLGLCAFLAFVKHFNGEFPLIVLDDVVSTVDTQHRRRVCELLYKEFADYQLFITTHDFIWFEELANYQRAYSISSKFVNVRILDWTLKEGLRLDRYKTRWEVLEDALSNGDRVGAGAHARRNLEWLLLEMAVTTETKIPIKLSGRYQVSDLYEPFKARFKKLVPDKYSENEHRYIQLEADYIGNLLIHNNPGIENASMDEVRAFVKAVRDLYGLFSCERDQFVEYHRSAKVMQCRCKHIVWETK